MRYALLLVIARPAILILGQITYHVRIAMSVENEMLVLSMLRSQEDAERAFAIASFMLADHLARQAKLQDKPSAPRPKVS